MKNNETIMKIWLTLDEFTEKYEVSSTTLWRRVKSGDIKTKKINGKKYYLDEDPNRSVYVENESEWSDMLNHMLDFFVDKVGDDVKERIISLKNYIICKKDEK